MKRKASAIFRLIVFILSFIVLLILRAGYVTSACWADVEILQAYQIGLIIVSAHCTFLVIHFLFMYLCISHGLIRKRWDMSLLMISLISAVPWIIMMLASGSMAEPRCFCFAILEGTDVFIRIIFLFRKNRNGQSGDGSKNTQGRKHAGTIPMSLSQQSSEK